MLWQSHTPSHFAFAHGVVAPDGGIAAVDIATAVDAVAVDAAAAAVGGGGAIQCCADATWHCP